MPDGRIEYQVRANTDGLDKDLNNVGSTVQSHGSKWSSVMEGVGQRIGSSLMDMGIQAAKAAWEMGSGFEAGLAKVSTLMDTSVVSMETVSAGLLDLSGKYGLSAQAMTEAAYNAVSSYTAFATDVDGLNQVLDASARLAAAGFTDIDTATSATLKTMNAYGLGLQSVDMIQRVLMQTQNNGITTVGELGSVLSNVTPTAAAMGVSFEQVGAALATMTAQGTPAAQATTQLNSLFAELGKNGTTASTNLQKAAEGTQYAGMSFQEMMAAGVPLNEVLQLMADYAAANGLSLLDMFSSVEAGKAALANTGANAEAFTNNLAAMGTEADVVGEAFDKVSGTSAYQLQQVMTQLQNVLIQLFQAFGPVIQAVLDLLAAFAKTISEGMGPFQEKMKPIIEVVGRLIEKMGPLIETFMKLTGQILDTIGEALGPLMESLEPIIDVVVKVAEIFMKVFGEQIKNAIKGAVEYIRNSIEGAKQIFQGIIEFIQGVFSGNWEQAWNGLVKVFENIIKGLANAFKAPINAIIDGINAFTGSLANIKIPDWVPGIGGMGFNIPKIPRLKVGMDYIPTDDFPAILHKGEAVLTAGEAAEWRGGAGRSGAGGSSADVQKLAQLILQGLANVSIPVYLDGRQVGKSVEQYVSAEQASRYDSMQRSGRR